MRAAAILLLVLLTPSLAACTPAEPDPLPNVRLGMSPRDVRDRFAPSEPGSWQTLVGAAGDDTALDWSSPSSRIEHAHFEFHLGMLVAIRAHLRDAAPPVERVDATPKTVTVKRAATNGATGTDVTVLSRDCPTHHEEAESLARLAAKR